MMSPRSRRWRRIALSTLIGLVLGTLACEFGLRWLLFGESTLARRLGQSLRYPEWYADGDSDDDYWKLRWRFRGKDPAPPRIDADPRIGWVGPLVQPGTYAAEARENLHGRRPVLLYGDSFAACVTASGDCFQGLLANSELGTRYELVNLGVGGFGTDQSYLLLHATIDQWKDLNPIVIFSLLVDSDLDRCVLSFRDWPKPRLELKDGVLVLPGPVETDPERYVAEHPLGITSYLGRLLQFRRGLIPGRVQSFLHGDISRRAEKEALNRAILQAVGSELDQRHLAHCVLSFFGREALAEYAHARWQPGCVASACREHSIPHLSTRPYLEAAAAGDKRGTDRFFVLEGVMREHYNRLGNRIVFEAIRQAILGHTEREDTSGIEGLRARGLLEPDAGRIVERTLLGHAALVYYRAEDASACFADATTGDAPHLGLRASAEGPTRLEWTLVPNDTRLSLSVHAVRTARSDCEHAGLRLAIEVDGRQIQTTLLDPEGREQALVVPLTGASRIALTVDGSAPSANDCAWALFDALRFE